MITAIDVSDNKFEGFALETIAAPFKELQNIAKVNIFIGPNNSGKSRFMRLLFADDNLRFISNETDIKNINELLTNFIKTVKEKLTTNRIDDLGGVVREYTELESKLKNHLDRNSLVVRSLNSLTI